MCQQRNEEAVATLKGSSRGISIFVLGAVTFCSAVLLWYVSAGRVQRWRLMSYDSASFVSGAVTCRSSALPWYESAARDQKWWLMTQHVRMPGKLTCLNKILPLLRPDSTTIFQLSVMSNFLTFILCVSDDPNHGAEHDETGQHEQCDGGQPSGKLITAFRTSLVIHSLLKFS